MLCVLVLAALSVPFKPLAKLAEPGLPIVLSQTTLTVNGVSRSASILTVRLDEVLMKVGLAHGLVGRTESLSGIAQRYGALAAINGGFFEAYDNTPIKNPNHTLITNGAFVHIGNVGTMVGFQGDDAAKIGRVQWTIEGSRNGSTHWPDNWFAYWINRSPGASTVTVFTPAWGTETPGQGGTDVVVDGGTVNQITAGTVPIPPKGFVIYFKNAETSLLKTFKVGQTVAYSVVQKGQHEDFWDNVAEGVGAGPTLVKDGKVTFDPVSEGFSNPKILSNSGLRSALGLTADGKLLMVTTWGTEPELASMMQTLGATDAMNLDGGASSGLWFNGNSIRTPGREISNALLVLPKPKASQ